jgi:endo-1,4-beta-xylanase
VGRHPSHCGPVRFHGRRPPGGFCPGSRHESAGHNLVWGAHNPDWLAEGKYSTGDLSSILHHHIQRVVDHYRGKVFAWDVVNEAFDENGNLRPSIWYNLPGIGMAAKNTAYIEQAFRWAHDADPQALLFYNDAEGEAINPKSDAIYGMVKEFKRRGVPIDGVGLQMHLFNLNADVDSISANVERLTKLGVQVHITEMDVALPVDPDGNPLRQSDLLRQEEIYRRVAAACLRYQLCTALQTWGFTDKYSWIGWFTKKAQGDALLFDRKYHPKAAYDALNRAMSLAAAAKAAKPASHQ